MSGLVYLTPVALVVAFLAVQHVKTRGEPDRAASFDEPDPERRHGRQGTTAMSHHATHTHDHHGHDRAGHGHGHSHGEHGHSHGLVHRSIMQSREGLRAVGISLGVLGLTAAAQAVMYAATGSVALLADLIHNIGDALTAIPVGIAFLLRSFVAEKRAGYLVVAAIFISACVAGYETIARLIHPQHLDHLWTLAAAGLIGFVGNELAAQVRLRAGKRLNSPALIADGNHARADGYVSLSVVASAAVIALGFDLGDPLIGLAITIVILRITWQSIQTIKAEPGPGAHDGYGRQH
jgi:Co/Zn/Cd efflux system component